MTDPTAFDRQLSSEISDLMGPVRLVDDAAIFNRTTTTQSPKWRVQPMFNATKFVVAGAIVALFGGVLVSGVLTSRQGEERLPAAAATSSASPATPTDSAATSGPGTFSPTGSLIMPRAGHTATLLQDGRVLVVGGTSHDDAVGSEQVAASAEIWDPETGEFQPTGGLAEGRSSNTATLLQDGRVLVVGGRVGGGCCHLASAVVWDPETGSFDSAGTLGEARDGHTATLLQDGRVLVVGGWDRENDNGSYTSAEIWDPATGEFHPTGTLIKPRAGHLATLLADGRVLVVGGWDYEANGISTSAEVWDPATGSFSPAGASAAGHRWGTATLLLDGRVLVALGNDGLGSSVEVWDPETAAFEPAGSTEQRRATHTATLLPGGRVLIVGGGPHGDKDTWVASSEIWDPVTKSFGPAASLAQARGEHTATALPDGRVLIIGGYTPGWIALASAEIWKAGD